MPADPLRSQLVELLSGEGAHVGFERAISGLPKPLRSTKPEGAPHSAWELLEHIRIAQWDILEFSRNPRHESPKWPDGYWPQNGQPHDDAWERSVTQVLTDLKAMQDLVSDASQDLFQPFPHGTGQNLLREALLVADHNAYHVGELVFLRKQLGAWR